MGGNASKTEEYGTFDDFEEENEDFMDLDDSPRSQCSTPDTKGVPGDTLIIFDWDDTLLCSSAINHGQWTAIQLQQLERTVEGILNMSMKLGETMIITNGNATWVEDSMRRFLPRLTPTVARLKVVSARKHCEEEFPGDPFAWKRETFRHILEERQNAKGGRHSVDDIENGLNLIVIGDSPAEMEAAQSSTQAIGGFSLVKTVKFTELPTVQQVLGQLRRTARELGSIVHMGRSVSRGLEQRELPPHLAHMAAWASGWRVSDWRPWSSPQMPICLFKHEDQDVVKLETPETLDWMTQLKASMSCYAVPAR